MRVLVRHVMTRDVVTVPSSARCGEIAGLMLDRDLRELPVVEADGSLAGTVTETALLEHVGGRRERLHTLAVLADPARHPHPLPCMLRARDLMSGPVVTADPQATVPEAIRTLVTSGVHALPVVDDDGRVIGIVGRSDLLRGLVPMIRSLGGVVGVYPLPAGRRRLRSTGRAS